MTEATSPPQTLTGGEETPGPAPNRRPRVWRRLVLTVLAAVTVVASLLVLGLDGLIPFGLLLAFSTDADEEESGRSVILTRRNLGLAAAMVAAFAWFWLWHLDLTESMLVRDRRSADRLAARAPGLRLRMPRVIARSRSPSAA